MSAPQPRKWHVTVGGDPAAAVQYGLTLIAKCGLKWVPTIYGNASKYDLPECEECQRPGAHRLPGQPTYVYRCFDETGRLIYVGCSSWPRQRMDQHKINSWWFHQVKRITYTVFPNRDYALEREREAIRSENPKWNVSHRDRALWTPDDYRDHYELLTRNGASEKRIEKFVAQAARRYDIDLTDEATA